MIVLFVPRWSQRPPVAATIARASVGADKPVPPVVIECGRIACRSFTPSPRRALGSRRDGRRAPSRIAGTASRPNRPARPPRCRRANRDRRYVARTARFAPLTAYGLPLVCRRSRRRGERVAAAAAIGTVVVKSAIAERTRPSRAECTSTCVTRPRSACLRGRRRACARQQYVTGGVATRRRSPGSLRATVAFGPGHLRRAHRLDAVRTRTARRIDVDELISSGRRPSSSMGGVVRHRSIVSRSPMCFTDSAPGGTCRRSPSST